MDLFGGKEDAEASDQKPQKTRGRQQKQKQSLDESEERAEASNKPKMISSLEPMQKRQKQCTTKHAECSSNKQEKRGRKPKLTPDERRANRLQSCRNYHQKKADDNKALEEKCQKLEKEKKTWEEEKEELKKHMEMEKEALYSEINALKAGMDAMEEELPEMHAQVDKLKSEMSNQVDMVRMRNKAMEPGMQKLEKNLVNQDDQGTHVEDFELDDLQLDLDYLNTTLGGMLPDLSWLDPQSSKTKGVFPFGEGTSTGETKLSSDTVNVNGYAVKMENFSAIEEIFCLYHNIDSGFKVHLLESKNYFINTLAEVYKMAERKKHTLEEIKYMEDGIKDLEFAGIDFHGLMFRSEL